MAMSAAHDVQALIARLGASRLRLAQAPGETAGHGPGKTALGSPEGQDEGARSLPLAWPGLEDVLPDGGLPRGVVELAAPHALGGSTSLALAAVRAGQACGQGIGQGRGQGIGQADRAWCAWIDPEGTLHAPGVVAAGVDLARMLVVRPDRAELGRIVVKVVASGAFRVVVIDADAVPRAPSPGSESTAAKAKAKKTLPPEVLVRRLALAAEPFGTTVLLLTDATRPRAMAWPVALRLELARPERGVLSVRVAKDRRGRIGLTRTVPFQPVTLALGVELPRSDHAPAWPA